MSASDQYPVTGALEYLHLRPHPFFPSSSCSRFSYFILVAHQSGGHIAIDYALGGLRCHLRFPLTPSPSPQMINSSR